MTALAESEALHERVRALSRAGGPSPAAFDVLARDIARFQLEHAPRFRTLVAARGGEAALDHVDTIPAVPVDAFRLTRVAVFDPALDVARFSTSGTTGARRGVHAMRTTATYRELCLAGARRALLASPGPRVVVALAPEPGEGLGETSSLAFMMRAFMEELDGRTSSAPPGGRVPLREPWRWLVGPQGIDEIGLRRAADVALGRGEPLVVLATAFSLVFLLDALGERTLPLPPGSVVMQTGGFKGRSREVPPPELLRGVARALAVPEAQIVGEYGMTELSSQLYEGTLPGVVVSGPRGTFLPPPWLRVTPVDPVTLTPVLAGEVGLGRFVDLGNVDSAVAIVTQDLVRCSGKGIELVGRVSGAEPRGCSLALEEMVVGAVAP